MKRHVLVLTTLALLGSLGQAADLLQKPAAQAGKKGKKSRDESMWVVSPVPALPTNVTHHTFRSAAMRCDVGYCIYLPPSHARDKDRRYPVIYELHGANGNETRMLANATVLHEGILNGKVPEIVMVFPNGGRTTAYQDSADGRFLSD
jgi:Putative esterase